MKLIIDIPENNYNQIREGFYEDNCGVMAISIIDGTPIPDNATNGDVFNAIYADISRTGTVLMDDIENIIATNVNIGWWNAPYQKGGKCVEGITPTVVAEAFEDAISYIIKNMWNWRGRDTTSIDKVAMEQIIHDELPSAVFRQKFGGCGFPLARGYRKKMKQ